MFLLFLLLFCFAFTVPRDKSRVAYKSRGFHLSDRGMWRSVGWDSVLVLSTPVLFSDNTLALSTVDAKWTGAFQKPPSAMPHETKPPNIKHSNMHPKAVNNIFTTTYQLESHHRPTPGSQELGDSLKVTKLVSSSRART